MILTEAESEVIDILNAIESTAKQYAECNEGLPLSDIHETILSSLLTSLLHQNEENREKASETITRLMYHTNKKL